MEWEIRLLEKGRVTIPKELRRRLGLRKGDKLKLLLDEGRIYLLAPRFKENVIEKTKGLLKGVEPELSIEGLREVLLEASASKVEVKKE